MWFGEYVLVMFYGSNRHLELPYNPKNKPMGGGGEGGLLVGLYTGAGVFVYVGGYGMGGGGGGVFLF